MAQRMHCQICGRAILASMGRIAHHGFERVGYGNTPSCFGARKLPFEAARDALGWYIDALHNTIAAMRKARTEVDTEQIPVTLVYTKRAGSWSNKTVRLALTRENFEREIAQHRGSFYLNGATFDDCKARDLRDRDGRIRMQTEFLAELEARFAGWQQTHKREGGDWVKL
jgi:hypothetical protein